MVACNGEAQIGRKYKYRYGLLLCYACFNTLSLCEATRKISQQAPLQALIDKACLTREKLDGTSYEAIQTSSPKPAAVRPLSLVGIVSEKQSLIPQTKK